MAARLSQKEFEDKAREIHGDNFIFNTDTYVDMYTLYKVKCLTHGEFSIRPVDLIHQKYHCPTCMREIYHNKNKQMHIESIKQKHGDNYTIVDWLDFVTVRDEVIASCKDHGEYKTQLLFVKDREYGGCEKCRQLIFADKFIAKAIKVHNGKYSYDRNDYINSRSYMRVFCPEHGIYFNQLPSAHIQGQGCPECAKKSVSKCNSLGLEGFIGQAKEIHGDRYLYETTNYQGMKNFINITCKKHGEFTMVAKNFLLGGECPECSKEKHLDFYTKDFFNKIKEFGYLKNNDFSEAVYVDNKTPVKIRCLIHNEYFYRTPNKLKDGKSCQCKSCASLLFNRWTLKALNKIPNIRTSIGYFYYGTVEGLDGFKIGITSNLHHRKSIYTKDGVSFEYVNTKETTYYNAAIIENIVKDLFPDLNIKHDMNFGGKTEVYAKCIESFLSMLFEGDVDKLITKYSKGIISNKCTSYKLLYEEIKGLLKNE